MELRNLGFGLVIAGILVGGCSGEDGAAAQKQPAKEHVFQEQVETIDKAREVEKMLQQNNELQRQAMDDI
ncbi:MAG: hypothetical protein JKY89_13650 [Immundisolibacteraceae bacterium]|nr:hypothetical protein [Immundisolibacteraceae bacterium]